MVGDDIIPPRLPAGSPPGISLSACSQSSSPFAPHWSLYPRAYVAAHTPNPITINGDIDKPEWNSVPWSLPFDDIRGPDDAPPSERPTTRQRTRMKMMWDEDFLYVCALIESDFTVTAEFTDRNSPIFQKDSDFEVFLDPAGTCARYKELELNAINTVWNLMIDKPYGDGGGEYSGRIAEPGEERYYEVYSQRTATKLVSGTLNDPDGGGATWAVELALAHSDTLSDGTAGESPRRGDMWRINFSRVEKRGDVNWTWQPQRIWDPVEKRVAGMVNMHLPDSWGYVVFGGPATSEGKQGQLSLFGESPMVGDGWDATLCDIRDPSWPERIAAANIYYAQRRFSEINGGFYAAFIFQLSDLLDADILGPFINGGGKAGVSIQLSDDKKHYVGTVTGPGGTEVTVTDSRFTTSARTSGETTETS
uniref:Carbohydrate-binding domain-containing protein n=1 Tax=Odontella aurita TaxID=265563 RepID=A0A7S4HKW8_9STRA|mmetsp:Transcript_11639/g.34208  ORF Transcript_11639/g.34208 Transcript_11639/m.34208 type:complete len:421 (+) Transcript_11639:56-1318(+)